MTDFVWWLLLLQYSNVDGSGVEVCLQSMTCQTAEGGPSRSSFSLVCVLLYRICGYVSLILGIHLMYLRSYLAPSAGYRYSLRNV